ncbi:MAG: hypothetical protein ICV69_09695 [Thermoleophilaceae bacterium]|nr:hypothetical protein [Thermoleophilaceae bacterium]
MGSGSGTALARKLVGREGLVVAINLDVAIAWVVDVAAVLAAELGREREPRPEDDDRRAS